MLIVNGANTITLGNRCGVMNALIIEKNISPLGTYPLPFANATVAASAVAAFSGNLFTPTSGITVTDLRLENILCLGFGTLFNGGSATGLNRPFFRRVYGDCTNGIIVSNVFDIGRAEDCEMWEFTTTNQSWTTNALLTRTGTAFQTNSGSTWMKWSDCFEYGWAIGHNVNGCADVRQINCGADGPPNSQPGSGCIGFQYTGSMGNALNIGCLATAQGYAGIYINTTANNGVNNVRIIGGRFHGNNSTNGYVYVAQVNTWSLNGCFFDDNSSYGQVNAAYSGGTITDCTFANCGAKAIVGTYAKSLQITNPSMDGTFTLVNNPVPLVPSVFNYGAVGDGSTDDSAAITAALNAASAAGGGAVFLPPGHTYYCSVGITIPNGVYLYSTGFSAYPAPTATAGATLKFALATATCVTLGAGSNGPCGISKVNITRATGTPPSGSIGLLIYKCYNPLIEYVNVTSNQINYYFQGTQSSSGTQGGISANVLSIYSGAAYDAHIVQDSWPELRILNSRIGSNGVQDQNCTAYIRVTGGNTSNAAGGPNSLVIANSQFNQGNSTTASYFLQFTNQLSGSISDMSLWQITNCHVEGIGTATIYSDSTWTSGNFRRVLISNSSFYGTSLPFASLDAGTHVSTWELSNNYIVNSFTLAPTNPVNQLNMTGNTFSGAVSITAPSSGSSYLSSAGNEYAGGVTFAGPWVTLTSMDSGTITNSATGTKVYTLPATLTGWGTPTNGSVQNNFAGSSATLAQTGAAVSQIIATLKSFGLFGS
jgi:hypothetical protein